MDIKPVGQLKPVETGVKPVGQLKPIQSNLSPIGQLKEGDANIVVPKYTTPQELEIDRTLNFIQENSLRNMRDDEKDILKNMMKNPLTSKDELSDAIVTLQGKKAKQIDNSWITPDYYMKRDEKSGNYKPIALEQGEKIPVGYHAASIWGTKLSAKDDNAWQDIGKSLSNGVFALMGGVVDVAQMGVELATGSESETLRGGQNAIEGLKFEKDADLDRPVYNMEGITKFGDLLDKDRFDFSPQALWGTFNSVAESFTEYGLGVFTGGTAIKGAKALKYGYQGIDKALDLGKAGKLGALFTGSFFTNAGDALDRAHEAGLTGRDAPAYAMLETTVKSSIDAAFGLEGKILSNAFKSTEKEIFKNIIKKVERDATTGLITPKGFKQLGKEMATEYSLLAKGAIKGKQVVKDMFEEGSNEVATTFAQKAGENLWDKMTDDERGQFGTDALSAKSFGEYANSFTQGFISGGMMSVPSQVLKNNHDNQSINTYERVKEGSEAVNALKTDLNNALEKGEITPSEHEQANFKIDAYNKYNEETKSVNLKPEDEKKAFELSFQIQGLKTEIPTNENEISKLDPITRAKVESKQKQAKELQSELNDIIRQGEIKGEPIVPKKEEERIQKEKEKEAKANEKETKVTPKPTEVKVPKIKVAKVKSDYTPIKSEEDKRTYTEVTPDEFNENKFPSRSRHRMLRKELSDVTKYPKGEVAGKLMPREYTYKGETKTTYKVKLPDGKEIRLSSSMMRPEGFRGHMRTERLKGNAEGMPVAVKVIDLNNPMGEAMPEGYKAGKKVLKIYDKVTGKFLSWAKETHQGSAEALDKEGNALYTPEQIEQIKDLELVDETPADEVELTEIRKPILPVKQRAEEATKKIIEESKEKVKQSKNVSLTNEANKSKTVDTTNKNESEKENNTKPDGSSIRRKIVGYNRLSKEQKKSEFGVNLRNEIQKEAEDFGGSLKPLNKGKVQLLDSEGKQVKKASVKREQNVIDEEKALAKKTKDALNTVPTSLEQYIAMVVGRGGAFDKSVTKEIPDVPSLMKNNKGEGYSLESLYDGYKQESGLDNIDEKGFAIEVEGIIKPYLTSKGREAAIDYALEAYEKELNDGYTDKQIKELEAFAKENEIKESDVEKAKEIAQNATVEEYKEITQKIESKNENERNEQLAEQIFEDYFGDENGINDVFIKDESKKSGEEKGISENEYPDDVFQKSKKMPLLNITNISSSNLALKENGINGRLLNEKQVSELQKEIEGNYVSEVSDLFNNKKDDLRQKAYNYDNPIAEKDSNGVNLRIAEGLIRDKKKTYLLYADGKIVGEFGSVQDAKNVVKYIEDNLINKNRIDLLQKESANKGKIDKVVALIKKALPKVNVVFDENLEASGKWSPSKNTITVNPLYAGLDTPIHEGGHILIDAMGYNNRIIQAAIKQLRDTDLYKETKKRYPELSDEELDKEVLAEAIGREGADIFDKVEDRSKFKAYLDYIFDWLKQKLGMDKNIAKSLAKQIIGGVKTKNLEGKAGKEQLQKESKKNPLGARPLKFEQYAAEHGFSYEKETEKLDEASYLLSEAQEEYDIAKENAEAATTDEEAAPLEEILSEKEIALNAAKKNFAIKGKRTFEYKKYKKDFNAIQKLMAEKELSDYTTEELQDLISMLHGFDNKAAKGVRNDAMIKLAMIATKKQQEKFKGMEGYIESLSKTKDISPLQTKILHHSHFSENNPDIQAASLAFGNAVMDKITDANTKKATHEKLATKVIAEENKKLGVVGASANRFSSDSAKYFNWMENEKGELLTIEEAKAKGLSEAKINYLKFTRETIADYKGTLEENDFENAVMDSIRIDKSFMEAYKSEGLLPAFSYYLGGGANNLGKVRFVHNGQIKSYSEVEKEILASADRKSISGMAKALWELLIANIQARRQLKKGFNVDEKENPLEVKGEAEYSLNEKGQLVSKFDKPRAKDRGYSKDFYKAMNQFIDESAHTKHISKIMPLVDSVEYLNKNGYTDEGYVIKPNVAKWIEDWKKLQIFKEPHVNDPIIDAAVKAMRNLVASTTMWFNIPANVMNVFMGNYNSFRQENGKTLVIGNQRLFGGKGKDRRYGLDIVKKYSIVNQDYDSQPTIKAGTILSKIATFGTQVGEYQIQGSLGLGLMNDKDFESFEYTKDKYGNEVLTVKEGVDEKALKERMTQIKNRVTDIQGKYPESDRRNILRGEFGKAAFQFKIWVPDWAKERFGAKYINAYGVEKEGTFTKLMRTGIKEMYADLKKGDFKAIMKNKAFMSNLKGVATIGTLIALSQGFEDDEDRKKKGGLSFNNALSQVLFILDLEQDKYMVSNPAAALGKIKDLLAAFEALVTLDEKAMDKVKRIIPANKITTAYELGKKIID